MSIRILMVNMLIFLTYLLSIWSIVWRHYDQRNSYEGEHLNTGLLTVLEG